MEGEQDGQEFMRTEEDSCESAREWNPNPTQQKQKHWKEQGQQWPKPEAWTKWNDPWAKKKNNWAGKTDWAQNDQWTLVNRDDDDTWSQASSWNSQSTTWNEGKSEKSEDTATPWNYVVANDIPEKKPAKKKPKGERKIKFKDNTGVTAWPQVDCSVVGCTNT